MLFNSISFFIFLPIVFVIYWFLLKNKIKEQNIFIILASYFFYGWWDWRFLILIFISSLSDYLISIKIEESSIEKRRRRLLHLSIIINLTTLFFFKYYNFFIDNLEIVMEGMGIQANNYSLNIILPVGISFYTFQSMSYTLDVYYKDIKASKEPAVFFAYISFFPQLVAGPIERASQLIPQFQKKRVFNYSLAVDGLRQMLWGFLKKVVIADNCATYVGPIFENYSDYSASTLLLGMVLFAFQIYGDFSGYSDIAIGTAKLFGFNLMENFKYPFFAANVTDFWRRWHISLSTWLRDYLYTPMAIRTRNWGMNGILFSTLLTFTLVGFWHGANWTFIVFGIMYGIAINIELLTRKKRKKISKKMNSLLFYWIGVFFTFTFFCVTLVLFRSDSITNAFGFYSNLLNKSLFSVPEILTPKFRFIYLLILIIVFILVEWFRKNKRHVLDLENVSLYYRWGIYVLTTIVIIFFARFSQNSFIYFQF